MKRIKPEDRHTLIPAAYLVLRDGNKILLQRRFNTGFADGQYSLVAGHLDGGETFTQGIIREAKEEANITLKEQDLKMVHMIHKLSEENTLERINGFFLAKKWKGEIKNLEPHSCDDLSWFDIDDLPDNIIPEVNQALIAIGRGIFYSERGWE